MLGSLFNEITRDSWTKTPNNAKTLTYDSNGNPLTITYYQGDNVVFIETFTYDSNGNPIRIECNSPTQN